MKAIKLIFTIVLVLVAYSLPIDLAHPADDGKPPISIPSNVEALQANQSHTIDILATKTIEPPKPAINTSNGACNTGNPYKDFIYYKESTCNPASVNSIGCRGIGQACPGSKLPCGPDFACQDTWFSNYAMERYGSWKAAYDFWIANNWW